MNKDDLQTAIHLDEKIREAQMQLNAAEAILSSDKKQFVIQLAPGTYGLILTKEELRPFVLKNIEIKKEVLKQLQSQFTLL